MSEDIKMNMKEQLPKIGSDMPDGSVMIDVYRLKDCPYFSRPDYEKFKEKEYNTETDCASVLLGCDDANTLDKVAETQGNRRKEIVQKRVSDPNDEFPNIRYLSDEEWRAYSDIRSLILEIKMMLVDGAKMGEIKGYSLREDNDPISPNDNLFDGLTKCHSLCFLAWAEKNSFPLPDELKIVRKFDNTLCYFRDFVLDIGGQAALLYGNNREAPTYKEMLERYLTYKGLFPDIIQMDVESTEFWFDSGQQARDVKGQLLLSIAQRIIPAAIGKELPSVNQKMFGFYSKLKKIVV